MREKRILAAVGALGASCMAASTVLMGIDLANETQQAVRVFGFLLGAGGTFCSAGVAYYKGAIAA